MGKLVQHLDTKIKYWSAVEIQNNLFKKKQFVKKKRRKKKVICKTATMLFEFAV